jgi:hypothetical protein
MKTPEFGWLEMATSGFAGEQNKICASSAHVGFTHLSGAVNCVTSRRVGRTRARPPQLAISSPTHGVSLFGGARFALAPSRFMRSGVMKIYTMLRFQQMRLRLC